MHSGTAPEEKLLKLIRGQKAKVLDGPRKPRAQSGVPVPLPRHRALSLSLRIRPVLALGCIAAAMYTGASFLYPLFVAHETRDPSVAPLEQPHAQQDARPYSYYLEAARRRQVFNVPAAAPLQPAVIASEGPGSDATKDLSLVGIIAGVIPQAIIEDKKVKKTYYVNKGQRIGEVLVEDIQEGKIIINHNGSRFELYL
ncbi:MAG TPA: hypothetical protein VMD52_01475 [Patescibacteria group bacterium]|nr:hypothetical protein [Patescibacteria group bacterium]